MSDFREPFTAKTLKESFLLKSKIFKDLHSRRAYFEQDLSFLPMNLGTIPARDKQLRQLGTVFSEIYEGNRANAKCYGHSGTGKTLTVKWMTQQTLKILEDENQRDRLFAVHINCAMDNTSITGIASSLVNAFPAELQQKIIEKLKLSYPISSVGLSHTTYLTIFRECFLDYNKQMLIILDEFDKIEGFFANNSEELSETASKLIYFLMELSRGQTNIDYYDSNEKSTLSPPINLILISNSNQRVHKILAEHSKGRFDGIEVHFSTYTEQELVDVLKTRRPAFEEGVLSIQIIQEIAASVASADGHARIAIEVLGIAGAVAEREGSQKVLFKHVQEAYKLREERLISDDICDLNFDHTLTYLSLYVLYFVCQDNDEERELIPHHVLYEVYEKIYSRIKFKKSLNNSNLKGARSIRRYLDGQLLNENLCIVKGGRPRYYGIPHEYTPQVIRNILLKDHPIIRKHNELHEIIQYQIPEICAVFQNYKGSRRYAMYARSLF